MIRRIHRCSLDNKGYGSFLAKRDMPDMSLLGESRRALPRSTLRLLTKVTGFCREYGLEFAARDQSQRAPAGGWSCAAACNGVLSPPQQEDPLVVRTRLVCGGASLQGLCPLVSFGIFGVATLKGPADVSRCSATWSNLNLWRHTSYMAAPP